jgi:hypothetical protein
MTGIYFSANDKVLPWASAFLHILRETNPELPLRLVPFGDDVSQLMEWSDKFHFELHEDPTFPVLEEIGEHYELGHTPHGKYWFRRYAAFWGPFERFWYLDVRQLILADLSPSLGLLDDFDLIHYDTAINQVYEPGPHRHELLQERRGRGFNSGRWMARRGAFTLDEMLALGGQSLQIRDQLNPRNTDQAFINYCCDHKPLRTAHLAELDGDLASNGWARSHPEVYRDGGDWRVWDHGGLNHKKKLILLHWAGIPESPVMPHRGLYRRFRDCGASPLARLGRCLRDLVVAPPLRVVDGLRRNRWVNALWHGLKGRDGPLGRP